MTDYHGARKKAEGARGPLAVEWLAVMDPDNAVDLERIDWPSDGNWVRLPGFVGKAIASMNGLSSVEIKGDSNDYEVHGLLRFDTTDAASAGYDILESEAVGSLEEFPYIEIAGPGDKWRVLRLDLPAVC